MPVVLPPPLDLAGGVRCWGDDDPLMAAYHDHEWGRPVRGERAVFERVCLEAMQAGLSWRLVLHRREAMRAAFAGFDPDVLAGWTDEAVAAALDAPGVIRNRAKTAAVRTNSRATVALRDVGGLEALVEQFRPPQSPAPVVPADVPAVTDASTALSKALRRAGFVFVGPTTAYALMQALGLVDDHLAGCPVRAAVEVARGHA